MENAWSHIGFEDEEVCSRPMQEITQLVEKAISEANRPEDISHLLSGRLLKNREFAATIRNAKISGVPTSIDGMYPPQIEIDVRTIVPEKVKSVRNSWEDVRRDAAHTVDMESNSQDNEPGELLRSYIYEQILSNLISEEERRQFEIESAV